jgi:xanthine dehydrogenase YagR molybdenum-binding subunit
MENKNSIRNLAVGQPISRLEGYEKVTGAARYSAEIDVPDLLYGYIINSTITKGKIINIDPSEAAATPGVLKVFDHTNRPSLAWFNIQYTDMDAPQGVPFRPLQNNEVKFHGQPIAMVVADSFETARYAASLVKVEYKSEKFNTALLANIAKARKPKSGMSSVIKPPPAKPVGDFQNAFDASAFKSSLKFNHSTEHHNPIELFASTTVYQGKGKLTIYDKTQGTVNCQMYVANVFGLRYKDVQVISTYVGGAFGSGLRPQYQLFFSVLAALELKRNVQVMLDRSQMFTFGHRPPTIQFTRFGAEADGKVNALSHEAVGETSTFEDYAESVVDWSHMLYPAKNTLFKHLLVPLDVFTPLDMRAPGGSTGIHAIECAMDDLAYQMEIDPLDFRLINYTEHDESTGKLYSSKALKECYLNGAKKFGWEKRNPVPRGTRRGNKLVGYGMATGIWEAMQVPARASAVLNAEGKLEVSSAVTDIGTGTLTVMSQIAADEMSLSLEHVTFRYGDSKMAFSPIQGGSFTVASVGPAIKSACSTIKKKLFKIARGFKDSPFSSVKFDRVGFEDGKMYKLEDSRVWISYKQIIEINDGKSVKAVKFGLPNLFKQRKYSRAAHSAAFVEVEVDEELGTINVTRALTAVAAGKIINPKTAKSQILGGMVWGISKALHEESISDHRFGKYMNANLAEYHIPVHADIHDLEVLFVEEKDEVVNDLGVKGVGEIGLVAIPPAIANAIFNATGRRINDLPIHFDRLM